MKDKELELQFEIDLKEKVNEMVTKGIHRPTEFLKMVEKYGYFETSKRLVSQRNNTYGFTKLLFVGRTDLSIESLVVDDKYRSLFSESVVKLCERRLKLR